MLGTFSQANMLAHLLAYWSTACLALYVLLILLKVLQPNLLRLRFPWLHLGYIAARVTYGGILAVGQYIHWAGNPFTAPLTYLPLPDSVPLPGLFKLFTPLLLLRHGYFAHYMLSRYWMGLFWGIAVALVLYVFLRALRKMRPALLSALDIHLFVAGSLIITWPNVLLFILATLLVFLLNVVVVTVSRGGRTALYPSILIGFFMVFIFGDYIATLCPLIASLKFSGL
ncbi:MAG TPA: hypothetical protein VJ579_01260 [Candidatus Paceibacterota bacterium]|nr:hypothetical protein [Candidatus Paceibacterota bacterium]